MARLRVKLVLNEGGEGIPMTQLASISEEAEKFIRYLAADAGMKVSTADLIARHFENRSVRFNIEDDGLHPSEDIRAFNAALRYVSEFKPGGKPNGLVKHQTLLQYTKCANALRSHEKLSFGLFQSGEEEPYEYRPLTKSNAVDLQSDLTSEVSYTGTIQGSIHTISPAELWFHFRSARAEKLVRCTFREPQYSKLIKAAERRRALVFIRGRIKARRFDREIQSVQAVDVSPAPILTDERYRAFFGADPNYTGDQTSAEFIEAARNHGH